MFGVICDCYGLVMLAQGLCCCGLTYIAIAHLPVVVWQAEGMLVVDTSGAVHLQDWKHVERCHSVDGMVEIVGGLVGQSTL